MTFGTLKSFRGRALAGCATTVLALHSAAFAQVADTVEIDIEAQELGAALTEFGVQTGNEIYFVHGDVAGKTSNDVEGSYTTEQAISDLLDSTGVDYRIDERGVLLVGDASIQRASLGEEQSPQPFRVAQVVQSETSERVASEE